MENDLTAEQWQAIAEKLGEYIEGICCSRYDCDNCGIYCNSINQDKTDWINQAEQELGYETVQKD